MSTRNGTLDIMRLPFAALIVMFHFFHNGSYGAYNCKIGVEYFSILAGVFYTQYFMTTISTLDYQKIQIYEFRNHLIKKYIQFFWYNLLGYVLAFTVYHGIRLDIKSFQDVINIISNDIFEVLLIKMNGLNNDKELLNIPAWNLQAMLVAEFILGNLLIYCKNKTVTMIAPIFIMSSYAIYYNSPKNGSYRIFGDFTTLGILRVIACYFIGLLIWHLITNIKHIKLTNLGRMTITFIELASYISVVILCINFKSREIYYFTIILLILALIISLSGQSLLFDTIKSNKITKFIPKLSMIVYVIHYPIIMLFWEICKILEINYKNYWWLLLIAVMIVSIYFTIIVNIISKLWSKHRNYFISLFIK